MTTTIKVRRKKGDKNPAAFEFDFGDNATVAIAAFGADVVYAGFVTVAKQQLQDYIRRLMAKKKNPPTNEQIQAQIADWKPGVRRRGKSAVDKAAKIVAGMTDEQRAAFMRELGVVPSADDAA